MQNATKLKLILAFMSLLFCIATVQQTYAKYVTSTKTGAQMAIARWRILVNNEDVHTGQALENDIEPIFTGNNYISANVIAPTSEGYFDIAIDSTNTDLSFTYSLLTTVSSISSVSDLVITGYSINNGEVLALPSDHIISGNIIKSTSNSVNTIRVFVKWNDDEGSTMDNQADTDASYDTDHRPLLNVNLSFVQINA